MTPSYDVLSCQKRSQRNFISFQKPASRLFIQRRRQLRNSQITARHNPTSFCSPSHYLNLDCRWNGKPGIILDCSLIVLAMGSILSNESAVVDFVMPMSRGRLDAACSHLWRLEIFQRRESLLVRHLGTLSLCSPKRLPLFIESTTSWGMGLIEITYTHQVGNLRY